MREKSERANPVAQVDDDNSILTGKLIAPIEGRRGGAGSEPTSINKDHHGSLSLRIYRRRPYVQIKAVFTYRLRRHGWEWRPVLHALRFVLVGVENTAPMRHVLRRSPSEETNWRCCEGYALVDSDVAFADTAYNPRSMFELESVLVIRRWREPDATDQVAETR